MSARYLGRFQTDPFVLALVGTVSVATLIPYQGEIRPSGGGHRLSRDRCARPCAGRQCREPPRLDAVARSLDRPYHDPFVLFGFLAGCTNIGDFSTQVLILAQRQTVLVAKQAACLDVLSGGRFRLGIGVGWNEVEFTGLNENFRNRGRRSEEQVQVMQALWAQDHVVLKGKYHTIDDAGINPRPASARVPVWFGGHHELTLPRIAKWGDGWMPNAYAPDQSALEV